MGANGCLFVGIHKEASDSNALYVTNTHGCLGTEKDFSKESSNPFRRVDQLVECLRHM